MLESPDAFTTKGVFLPAVKNHQLIVKQINLHRCFPPESGAIAENRSIRDVHRLRRKYGTSRWRKVRGTALVRLEGDIIRQAELHWYEAHGIGRKEIRIKRLLD